MRFKSLLSLMLSMTCAGCAYVPNYDIPNDKYGQPTVKTIIDRIKCEIVDMVRDDRPDDVTTFHRLFLLNQDYDVEASLSLDVNDTGGLAPNISSIVPFTAATSFAWGGIATLSESRDQNFTENLHFSVRELYNDWHARKSDGASICPQTDTNLAGNLGIKDIVAMADGSTGLDASQSLGVGKGAFGGSVQFLLTRSLTAAGPTWTLTHFKGPGGLGSLSRINTDKLTIAFAEHQAAAPAKPGAKPAANAPQRNQRAYELMLQIQTNAIGNQLFELNSLR